MAAQENLGVCGFCDDLFVGILISISFIVAQYVVPVVNEAYQSHIKGTDGIMSWLQTILRLAMPNTALWILMFFSFFQFFLNILAELTYFADRQFYKEWWNCKDLGEYWRLWNLPVHDWFLRHMYNPIIRRVSLDLTQVSISRTCCVSDLPCLSNRS